MTKRTADGWEIWDYHPESGKLVSVLDLGNGTMVQRTQYLDMSGFFEENKRAYNESVGKKWGAGQVVASIPDHIYYREIMPAKLQDDKAYIRRWINDSDHRAFRRFHGNI